ncbi:MAG: hypothetical protein PVF85_08855 [Anaerolineales bacterium]|jgi:hypothetical protein
MTRKRRTRDKKDPAKSIKSVISVGAVAATIVGWGAFARQALQTVSADPPVDVRAMVEEILGEIPGLASVDLPQKGGNTLRTVSLPRQSSSRRPSPITHTQSSR